MQGRKNNVDMDEFIKDWNSGMDREEIAEKYGFNGIDSISHYAMRKRKLGYPLIKRIGGPKNGKKTF